MDSKQYAPGTVWVATVRGEPETKVIRRKDGWAHNYIGGLGFTPDDHWTDITDIRPLVVLDLPNPGALVALLRSVASGDTLRGLADQIEQQTRPPRPAEPTAMWSVVVDRRGDQWVRVLGPDFTDGWVRAGDLPSDGKWTHYADIDTVKVLSEGVAQ